MKLTSPTAKYPSWWYFLNPEGTTVEQTELNRWPLGLHHHSTLPIPSPNKITKRWYFRHPQCSRLHNLYSYSGLVNHL